MEISAEISHVVALAETGVELGMASHATRVGIHGNGAVVLAGIREIGQVQEDQRAAVGVGGKGELEQICMRRSSHLNAYATVQGQAEVSGTGLQRIVPELGPSGFLWEGAVVHVVAAAAGVREKREETEGWAATGSGIVHLTEAGDIGSVRRETTLVAPRVRVRDGFGLRRLSALDEDGQHDMMLSTMQSV